MREAQKECQLTWILTHPKENPVLENMRMKKNVIVAQRMILMAN
jgi:hypothetical protein